MIHWIRKNISACVAIMITSKHTKDNLNCLDESKTLLTSTDRYFLVTNTVSINQGVYLNWDTNDYVWIRSSKVTGLQASRKRDFLSRHDEHVKKASAKRLTTRNSIFYTVYPASTNKRVNSKTNKGVFDDL